MLLQTRLVARLPCKPLEEAFELRECSMQGCLAQFLARLLSILLGEMPLERYCLLKVKALEISVGSFGVGPR